jgi:outer membrane protein TolC
MPKADHGPMKFLLAAALAALAATSARAQGLTLEAAMREAMANSEEALILKEKQNKFDALKQQAWSTGFPRITANANAAHVVNPIDPAAFGFGSGPVQSVELNRFAYDLEVQQSIFSFGRLSQAIRTANVQEKSDTYSRGRSLQQLQLQVLDSYGMAVLAKAKLQTLEASVKRSSETVAFLESNWKMGSGRRAEVLRAITALKSLEPERIRAQRDAEAAAMVLNRIMGRDVEAPLDLDTTAHMKWDPVNALPDSQALASVVDERPDIKSLEYSRRSLEGQARYMKMLYLPSLGANGKWGITAYDKSKLADFDKSQDWMVGLGLQWTLFDGMGTLAQARQVQSDARSLSLTQRQMKKMVKIEITGAFQEYHAADTALAAAGQAVAAAQEAQALLSQDFRAGKGAITEVLESEDALRNAQLGYLAARYQRVHAQAALRVALGKGLINEEVQ